MARPTAPIGPVDPLMEELKKLMQGKRSRSQPLNLNDLMRGAGLPPPAPSAPIPFAPAGGLGPLSTDTSAAFAAQNPEPVPPAFTRPAPIDMSSIDQRVGPAPTAPVEQAPGLLDKISAVLSGVAYGPAAAERIRAEREAPFRRFEQQTADYTQRRDRAFEMAERQAEREAAQATRMAEIQYEKEFRTWERANANRDAESKQRMANAFQLELQARRQRLEEEQEQRRELRARQDDARGIAARYGTGPGAAPPAVAKEIGEYIANLRDGLSPAGASWWRAQANRTGVSPSRAGAPSKAAQAALDRFNLARQAVIGAVQRGDKQSEKAYREAMNRAFKSLARYPGDIQMSETVPGWPYAELRNAAPTAAPQQQPKSDPLGVR